MKVDYIIVGLGLAGLSFTEELIAAQKSFIVFEDYSQTSSLVAGGVYNPIILKRFTPVWNAKEQLQIAMPFYKNLEVKLEQNFDQKLQIKRPFKSIEEQNNWFLASDKPLQKPFINPNIYHEKHAGIIGDFGYGEVYETGRIDSKKLVNAYRDYLSKNNLILFEEFQYNALKLASRTIHYKHIEAKKVIFCEGFGVSKNPFFNHLPLDEVKGELITIHAPDLNIKFLLKSALFLIPLGDNNYRVGATFNHHDKTSLPSEEGKEELIEKLKKVITVPYKIIDQWAGIRPATKDRKPFVGIHHQHNNLAILNGLGTRGVMIAPTLAKQLYQHLEYNKPLDEVSDIKIFSLNQ